MSWLKNNEWLNPQAERPIRWLELERFSGSLRKFRRQIALAFLIAIVNVAATFCLPTLFRLLGGATQQRRTTALVWLLAAYFGALALQVVAARLLRIVRTRISTGMSTHLVLQYYGKLLNAAFEDFLAFKQRTNMFQRLIDAMSITPLYLEVVLEGSMAVIMLAALVVVIGMISVPALGVVAGGAILLFAFVHRMSPKVRRKRQQLLAVNYPLVSKMLEILDSLLTIKALVASERVANNIATLVNRKAEAERAEVFVDSLASQGGQLISSAALVACMGVALLKAQSGALGYTDVFTLFLLAQMLLGNASTVARLYQNLSSLSVNVASFYEVFDLEDESRALPPGAAQGVVEPAPVLVMAATESARRSSEGGSGALRDPRSRPGRASTAEPQLVISCRSLDFSYRNGNRVLRNLSLSVQDGEHISIIGQSGSGKTTFFRVLLGFLTPQGGELQINGRTIASYADRNEYRRQFGVVSQNDFFFETSIRENLTFGLPVPLPNEELLEALGAVNLADDVLKMPDGLDTVPSDDTLSGGQRQRLLIARALLRKSPLILLDEPTSALDFENESKVLDAIENLVHRKTTCTIAHRLSTVQRADRVVVFSKGTVVANGTHRELLEMNAYYRSLCEYNSFLL